MQKRKLLIKQCIAVIFSVAASCAFALTGELPEELRAALMRAGLPESAAAVWVSPAGSDRPVLAFNEKKSMQPASIIKTVTTLAALDLHGPGFVWKTDFTARRLEHKTGTLKGLGARGGDPHYMIERLWVTVQRLKSLGVRKIDGNIVIDRSMFDVPAEEPGAFDGAAWRTYNVGPDAAMINLSAVSLTFTPESNGKWARVAAIPQMQGVSFPARIAMKSGPCGAWREQIRVDFSNPARLRFLGRYPEACGERALHVSFWERNEYFTRVFKHVLSEASIAWNGRAVSGNVPQKAQTLLSETSEPLPLMVNWTNKFSNNPMARQIFLALSFADADGLQKPAALNRSRKVLQTWLEQRAGVQAATISVDNGSGLSRKTRASAESLGRLLNYGWRSAVMPEFMSSLPVTGEDGTMRKRPLKKGVGHIKTGLLSNVRSAAGYVLDDEGRRWSVVVMLNSAKFNGRENAFTDAVLEWCASGRAQAMLSKEAAALRAERGVKNADKQRGALS